MIEMTDQKYSLKPLPNEVKTDIRVLFFGGGAGHIAEDLSSELEGVDFPRAVFSAWAFNTDREDLNELPSSVNKVLLGQKITGGCGAGSNPENGLLAAQENHEDINAIIAEGDIVIFFATLGGGTGTGSIPYAVEQFWEQVKDQKDKPLMEKRAAIVIVTEPYTAEGLVKQQHARNAWKKLYGFDCPIISISNDQFLFNGDPNRTIRQMNKDGNSRIAQMLGRLIRSLGKRHNLNNIDRNDIISNLLVNDDDIPDSFCGVGYGAGATAVKDALEQAAINSLLHADLRTCKKAIIAIDCDDAKQSDQEAIHDFIAKYRVHPDADWRVGLHDQYEPLAFEAGKEATAVAMILGVSAVPFTDAQMEAQQSVAEAERSLEEAVATATVVSASEPNEPTVPQAAAPKPACKPVNQEVKSILDSSIPKPDFIN